MKTTTSYIAIILLSTAIAACGGSGTSSSLGTSANNQMGATQGGSQDLNLARDLVLNGRVPPADAFIVEAIYSEHDLPIEGPVCDMSLCVRGAMGIGPDATDTVAGWIQLGLSSNVDAQSFQRRPITIIATVDTSGSMGYSYPNESQPIDVAKQLLHAINSELNENDRVAIVSYGSNVSVPLPLTTGDDPYTESVIGSLTPGGGTNMEAGLTMAYALATQARETSDNVRVLLFSDEQPNIGATAPSRFQQMALDGAAQGVELTVLGIGLGLSTEFTQVMSHMRGANAFSVMHADDVDEFVADNWPWMVSPIAYDLSVNASLPSGLSISQSYGFPNDGTMTEIGFDVSTVFLSKNRGALLLKVQGETLQYQSIDLQIYYSGTDGLSYESALQLSYDGQTLDENGYYMPQIGIAKTVALTLLVTELKRSAELYGSDPEQAIQILSAALTRLQQYATSFNDAGLTMEAEFWPQLLNLMQQGAEQGNFYGAP